MKNPQTTSKSSVLHIEKEGIIIVVFAKQSMILFNKRNKAVFFCSYSEGDSPNEISFRHLVDGKNNIFCTGEGTFSYCGKTYELENPGDSVNVEDGSIVVYLKYSYMLELLESSFYVYGQTKVYDFIKEEFLIPLS